MIISKFLASILQGFFPICFSAGRGESAEVFDCYDASLSSALLASQSAAHAAAQAVQAVATATARGVGLFVDRSKLTPGTGRGIVVANRAAAAATHAANTATTAANVISAAVSSRQSRSINGGLNVSLMGFSIYKSYYSRLLLCWTFQIYYHALGFPQAPHGIYSGLDLLIGEPDETVPGTNQEFLSLAAGSEVGTISSNNPSSFGGGTITNGSIPTGEIPGAGLLLLLGKNESTIRNCVHAATGLEVATARGFNNAQSVWREPTAVVVGLISLLGHLSSVCPNFVVPLMDDLIPILAYMLQDTACYAKRSVSQYLSFYTYLNMHRNSWVSYAN